MVDDKVAVVAGVGPGIGARFVETFAQGGYRAALARNPSFLDQSSTTPLSSTSTARASDSKINAKPESSPPRSRTPSPKQVALTDWRGGQPSSRSTPPLQRKWVSFTSADLAGSWVRIKPALTSSLEGSQPRLH